MKKCLIFIILLLIASLLLPSCGKTVKESDSHVSAKDYYEYLNESYLPKRELAPSEPVEIWIGNDFDTSLSIGAKAGIISADVRDFDNDGDFEMLVLGVGNYMRLDTYFASYYYDDAENVEIDDEGEDRALVLYATLLDFKNGEIVENSTSHISVLPLNGWGNIYAALEKIDDTYYLFSGVYQEDYSSYGPRYSVVATIDSGITKCAVSPISAYSMNSEQAAKQLGIQSPINTELLSISDLPLSSENTKNAEACRAALENRLLCYIGLDFPEGDDDHIKEQLSDFTKLREYLNVSGEGHSVTQLPEGYLKEASKISQGVTSLLAEIDSAAASKFSEKIGEPTTNENGLSSLTIDSDSTTIYIAWNKDGNITSLSLYDDYSKLDNGTWYAAKDAILKSAVLSLPDTPELMGKTNWTDYMNGITCASYTVSIHAVGDVPTFSLSLN